jgi:hypothetical protein
VEIIVAPFDKLEPAVAYDLWRLRQDVFVVEQDCPYPDLDGRDLEPTTAQVMLLSSDADDAGRRVLGAARVLDDVGAGLGEGEGQFVRDVGVHPRGVHRADQEAAGEGDAGSLAPQLERPPDAHRASSPRFSAGVAQQPRPDVLVGIADCSAGKPGTGVTTPNRRMYGTLGSI